MESDKKKLFVGGLLWKTTDESLREHFSKYGTVESSSVCWDWNTGTSRGFGFVSFSDSSSAEDALRETHVIDGRKVEVNEAIPEGERHNQRHSGLNNNNSDGSSNDLIRNKKIFVGGLASNVTEEELRKYFEEFGTITDAVVIQDRATDTSRGFGFITFDSEESFEKVMRSRFYHLGGKPVEVKRAVPKDGNNNLNTGFNAEFRNGRWSSPFNGYQHVIHPHYGYGYGYGCGEYFNCADGYGGWPVGAAYGGMVYWVPYISPCFPWNGTWRNGAAMGMGCTLPNATSYPSSVNCRIGVVGMNGFHDEITGVDLNGNSNKMDEVVCCDAASDKPEDQSDLDATSYPSSVNRKIGVVGINGFHDEITGVDLNGNSNKMDEVICCDAASDKPEDQSDLDGQCNGKSS